MLGYSCESRGKEAHDLYLNRMPMWVDGAIIVGAGPSGMATAACLKEKGVPSVLIEKAECIGSLWKHRTYDRLHLHIPKEFCELPLMPFPASYPTYPNRQQFLDYLESYARHFDIQPHFNESVQSAHYDTDAEIWRVTTVTCGRSSSNRVEEYTARWLIVASGENAEIVMPKLPGMKDYHGDLMHSSMYKNGSEYVGKKVLVVGCGNSGMEIALDLANFNAKPSLVVRGPVHVLPREIFGTSTFSVAVKLMRTFPVWLTDWLLVFYTWLTLGNVANYGFNRPKEGPMELKHKVGKTPILDVGTVNKIKSGHIKVVPRVTSLTNSGVRFENGLTDSYDAVILATGYRSNVPRWLKGEEKFFTVDGFPKRPSTNGWKGDHGLYAVGLGRKGLLGASMDARNIAEDIRKCYEIQKLAERCDRLQR
ncbi:hypothetical protein R1flu_027641 [Riccia fluitans]|uniref:Flavin-containing monooxygenase n=1 Tax=Riccia fluitans TaxID=41844 RepID=A0ABD1XJD4_9MARC